MDEVAQRTLRQAAEAGLVVKRSRFLGAAIPVTTESEARARLVALRKAHPDANHICYAYRIPASDESPLAVRFNDDGEPRGTAGRPILDVLQREDVWHALIAVMRYFGGTLLGAGGLVRAYTAAASAALKAAGTAQRREVQALHVFAEYDVWDRLAHHVEALLRKAAPPEYGARVELTLWVPVDEADALIAQLSDLGGAHVRVARGDRRLQVEG